MRAVRPFVLWLAVTTAAALYISAIANGVAQRYTASALDMIGAALWLGLALVFWNE